MHSLLHESDRRAIEERLLGLQAEDSARWGVMNAGEMVCHLRGAFLAAMGEIAFEPIALPIPRATMKAVALWAPVPWRRNFQTLPALKVGAEAMRVGDFAVDRGKIIDEMERFLRPEQMRVDHAFFGPMSFGDWMRWGYLHADHHLRQFGR